MRMPVLYKVAPGPTLLANRGANRFLAIIAFVDLTLIIVVCVVACTLETPVFIFIGIMKLACALAAFHGFDTVCTPAPSDELSLKQYDTFVS